MPRTRLDEFRKPKLDPLKAVILERKQALNLTYADIADILSCSVSTAQHRFYGPSDEWTLGELKRYAMRTGINVNDLREAIRI